MIVDIFGVVKSTLLKMNFSSRSVEFLSKINYSFAKYHSLSPNLKHNYEIKKSSVYKHCKTTCVSDTKISNIKTMKVEENYEECFKEIANGNPNIEKQLKIIEFELNIEREYNYKLPNILKKEHWLELLEMKNRKSRNKYLSYLFKCENKDKNFHRSYKLKVQNRNELWKELSKEHNLSYGLGKNCLFMRLYNQSINKLKYLRLLGACLYSQHVVFDCSYENYMTKMNKRYCATQLKRAILCNTDHLSPFHIKLCNVNLEDESMVTFLKVFQEFDSKIDFTNQSYLDFYPKEKLVYLTPHCKESLNYYSGDDIYIIGAFVDRGAGDKISLAKAKEQNLRMAKFPIDDYLIWKKGSKTLPLNIVLNILADMRLYRNWDIAFKNVPSRFLTD